MPDSLPRLYSYLRSKMSFDNFESVTKEYPRMTRIHLPPPHTLPGKITDIFERRIDAISVSEEHVSLSHLSAILKYSAGTQQSGFGTRMYATEQGAYCIETYLFVTNILGMEAGLYHYHPTTHSLEFLWPLSQKELNTLFSTFIPPVTLLLTSYWKNALRAFGEYGLVQAALQAGRISQNISLIASALQLHTHTTSQFEEQSILEMCDFDNTYEQPLLLIALGSPDYSPQKR